MNMRMCFNLTAYLVLGSANTRGREVPSIVRAAIAAGFTCVQIREKDLAARDIIALSRATSKVIHDLAKENEVALLINDRLDVALAAREQGIKIDGVHVGQDDIPAALCRRYMGEEAIVGVTARKTDMIAYASEVDAAPIDYFGVGPLHATLTKPDSGYDKDGNFTARTFAELSDFAAVSPRPFIVGGGVGKNDLAGIKAAGAAGFFVASAVAGADDPAKAAAELIREWRGVKVGI